MARGYLTTPISENLEEMPDGSLVARDCVIARTGSQTYSVRDLPQEAARDMGVDTTNPSAQIDLFRAPEDVFHPDTLRSGEGRPVTDGHPPQFVDPDNFTEYARGHMQNVRKGGEPLDSGDWPMTADVLITAEPLLGRVRRKEVRELSLGYDYSIEKRGPRIYQVDIIINHLAVVPRGRAGPEARINDAAPSTAAPSEPAAPPPGSGTGHAAPTINKSHKEKPKVKSNLLHLLGLGLRAKAADAETDPEELAQAAMDIGKHADDVTADDKRARDRKRGRDEEFEIEETGEVEDRRARDRKRGRDLDPDIEVTHTEDRKRLHDKLDEIMDARDGRAKDADLEALKDLLVDFFDEEEEEPQHAVEDDEEALEDADPAELEEIVGAGERPDAEDTEAEPGEEVEESGEEELEADDEEEGGVVCAHCGEAHNEEACPGCGCRDKKAAEDRKSRDRATAHDGAAATLRMLRPVIAQLGDDKAGRRAKSAFNTALGTLASSSRARATDANHRGFMSASRDRARVKNLPGGRARAADAEAERNTKLQEYYDQRRKEGK